MLNELVLVKVSDFKKEGAEADRHGVLNVYLQPIAGKIPNQAQVIAGTVAESNGLISGNLQLVLVNETAPDEEYGRQFSVTVLDGDIKGTEVLGYRKELGSALVLDTKGTAGGEGGEGGESGAAEAKAAKPSIKTSATGAKAKVK